MEVGKKTILNQFIGQNNSTQFVIPIYQRNYVWKKENVLQLLSDIESMMPYIGDNTKFHFFGSIVYIDTLHKGSFNERTIIDGQQRLTTIFLFLQVLRQIYQEQDKIISKKYLLNDEDIINSHEEYDRYRLKPLVTDDNMYLRISTNNLEGLTKEEEESNIYAAYLLIKKHLVDRKDKYSYETIIEALDKFTVVRIQLEKTEAPQQVFESINSTGVNLTAADLIRNYVLMNKDDKTQTELYNNYWHKIEFKYVLTKNLKEFFRFYISIKRGDTIADREVYSLFKKEYEDMCAKIGEKEVLEDILSYAESYGIITQSSLALDIPGIDRALDDYRGAKTNMPTMLLMEAMKLFREEVIDEKSLIDTINLITNYIVRRNVCGEESRFISYMFGNLTRRISKYFLSSGKYYESVVRALVWDNLSVGQYMPDDDVLREQFKKGNLYSREETGFVLKRIENNSDRVPYNKLNIEHIMPQTKTPFWEYKINDGSVYENVVNRIGNLTLVDNKDNSAMGNANFQVKKQILGESKHIKLNEYILAKEDWNEDEIAKRAEILAEKFISIFPYPKLPTELPLIVNLNEDDDDVFKVASNGTPIEINIGSDISFSVSSWEETFKVIIEFLYKYDKDRFNEIYTSIEKVLNRLTLRNGFNLSQEVLRKINIDMPVRILYTNEK